MSDFYTGLELPTELQSQSVALHQIGINDIAWPRDAALTLLQALRTRTIAVLGGDVLRLAYDKLDHTYDNWYTNPHPSEDFAHYAVRSQEVAAAYIQDYREHGSGYLYLLVLANQLPSQ